VKGERKGRAVAEHESPEHRDEKRRVAGIFARAAESYDQVGPRFFARFGERLTELADVRPGQTVLDLACGRGGSLFPAAQRVGPRGRVVGVDLAESMVDELTRDIAARGLRNAEARMMDGEDLRFPDSTFDRVLAGFCLFFFPRHEQALAEMWRVLRLGGRLALSTWGKPDPGWRWLDDLIDSYLADPDASPAQADDEGHFTESPERMRAVLLRAGFVRVDAIAETEEFSYISEEEWWATQWSHGVRGALEEIEARQGPAGLARFEAEAREHLRARGAPGSAAIHHLMPVLYSLADKPQHTQGVGINSACADAG
jgi:ubiquinone/menaquinone biosynthesis C-methylase UbiE